MLSNSELSRRLSLLAELLLLHNGDDRLAEALPGTVYRIRQLTPQVLTQSKQELSKLFRPEITRLLDEVKRTGEIPMLDELIQLTPQGIFEMMRLKGLGGKKLSVLWKAAKIDSVDALLVACKNGSLSQLRGFGKKTQENILAAIEAYRGNLSRFYYASVAEVANRLVSELQLSFKTKLIELCGEVRRQMNTVAAIEIIAVLPKNTTTRTRLQKLLVLESMNDTQLNGHSFDEIPITIYFTSKPKFYFDLFSRTGNEQHVTTLLDMVGTSGNSFNSEEAIYSKAGLPYVVPEMREDVAEWCYAGSIENLVTTADIKGVVHNHTTWSDGVDDLQAFVIACKQKKYEYVVVSDHSKNAHYAGGLKEAEVLEQMAAIDALNKKLKPFHIFKSIECDILVSGELDYDNTFLKKFDLVNISIHQLLKMDVEKATRRLIRAIENPYTT